MPFNTLPREVLEKIKEYHCPNIHPTAQIIKELYFDRDEKGERNIYNDGNPSLYVRGNLLKRMYKCNIRSCWMCVRGSCENARDIVRSVDFRRYILTDFTEPDRYVEHSDVQSGIILGHVRGRGAFHDDFTYFPAGLLDRPLS